MTDQTTGYENYPDHPLHDVPFAVLDAARTEMLDIAAREHIDADDAVAFSDAQMVAALPALRAWLQPQRRGRNWYMVFGYLAVMLGIAFSIALGHWWLSLAGVGVMLLLAVLDGGTKDKRDAA